VDREVSQSMELFKIHPQLQIDSHYLGKFPLCHILLHKNAVLPWFILVPESDAGDLLDLPEDARYAALQESVVLAEFIKKVLGYPKINFAAIGNVVPQLHLHVVGRRPGDPCWPAPVWGHLSVTREYSAAEVNHMSTALQASARLRPSS
jgi:diadenosine tetraphosphate (Ap4A) HIT family hydrolase